MALKRCPRVKGGLQGLAITTSLVATGAFAQDTDSGYYLGTLVLTGGNQDLTVKDTATSVDVVDAYEIERDIENATVQEAIKTVPNVYFPSTTGAPVIRGQQTQGPNEGMAAFMAGTVARATISVDGRNASINELSFGSTSLWNVDTIEVYRGPQTTSQGANSIAGAVVVNTKDPTFDKAGSLQLVYGSYNKTRVSGAYSMALSEDVAVNLSFDHSERDSYIEYTSDDFDAGDAPISPSNTTVRAKVLWAPKEISGLEAKLTYSYVDTAGPQGEQAYAPFSDRENTATSLAGWRTYVSAVTGDVDYEFDNGLRLTNQLVWSLTDNNRIINPCGTGCATVDATEISNDLRVAFGNEGAEFSGVAGFYASHTDGEESVDLTDYYGGVSNFDSTKDSLGLYAEATYYVAERVSVTGGLRYQRDQIQRDGTVDYLGVVGVNYDETFEAWLPSLSVAYDINADTKIGLAYSRGYNPGGISYSFTEGSYIEFDEETADNYELFLRGSFIGGALNLTANAFYTDLTNAQRSVSTEIDSGVLEILTVNAEKAHSYGLELSADYAATDRVSLWGNVGVLRTRFDTFSDAEDDYSGNTFKEAPEFTVSLGGAYDVTDRLTLMGDVTYVTGYYSDDLNSDEYEVDAYTIGNLRAEYRTDRIGTWFTYVTNVGDVDAATSISDFRGITEIANLVAPREFGVGWRMDF